MENKLILSLLSQFDEIKIRIRRLLLLTHRPANEMSKKQPIKLFEDGSSLYKHLFRRGLKQGFQPCLTSGLTTRGRFLLPMPEVCSEMMTDRVQKGEGILGMDRNNVKVCDQL